MFRNRTWAHPFKWMAGWYEGWVDGPYLPTKNHPVYLRGYKRGYDAQDRVERRSS